MINYEKIIGLLVALLILFSVPINVYASDFNCGNDGNARDYSTCYADSGLVSSFKNVEYYDAFVPYNITYEQLGDGFSKTINDLVHEWFLQSDSSPPIGKVDLYTVQD